MGCKEEEEGQESKEEIVVPGRGNEMEGLKESGAGGDDEC